MMEKETLLTILAEKGPFENEDDETACRELVEELSPDEEEAAAQTSFAYFEATQLRQDLQFLSTEDNDDDEGKNDTTKLDKTQLQQQFAMREARRHYIGEDRNAERALHSLREALSLRSELRVNLVRFIPLAAHEEAFDNLTVLSDAEKAVVRTFRAQVEQEFPRQYTITGGLDIDRSAVVVRFPRLTSETDVDGYLTTLLYVTERALAATEYYSTGRQEKVLALSEYLDYNSANAPPIWSLKDSVLKLQHMYPERLKKMILTDPPFWMRALYSLLFPLLSKSTVDKVSMTSGASEKETVLTELIGDNVPKSLPLLQEDWSISSNSIDIEQYLNQPMYQTHSPLESSPACQE